MILRISLRQEPQLPPAWVAAVTASTVPQPPATAAAI
jgi:hypothetical protein